MSIADEYIKAKYGYEPKLVKEYGQESVYRACLELQKNSNIPLLRQNIKLILDKYEKNNNGSDIIDND